MSEAASADYLLERLKYHGVDVYAGGPLASLRERLASVLIAERMGPVVVGRHNGKPETYEQLFERVFGVRLRDVPRVTKQQAQR